MSEQAKPQQVPPLGHVAIGTPLHADVQIGRGPDRTGFVMLRLETVAGSWCQPIPPGMAKALGDALIVKATEAISGIVTPLNGGLVVPQ